MWVEGGSVHVSVVYFCAVSILEASLLCWKPLLSAWCFFVNRPDKFPLATQVPLFVSPGAINVQASGCPPNSTDGEKIAH